MVENNNYKKMLKSTRGHFNNFIFLNFNKIIKIF